MKNIDTKIKKALIETVEGDLTIVDNRPPAGYEQIPYDEFNKKDKDGCIVAKGNNGKFYLKTGSCPSTPPADANKWDRIKDCLENTFSTSPIDYRDDIAHIETSEPNIYDFNINGSLTIELDTGKKYTGVWKCYSNKLKMATCEDNQVYYQKVFDDSGVSWTADTENWGKTMGCAGTPPTPPPTTFSWDTTCDEKNSFKKGCKDGQIRELQKCLNKSKKTTLPDLVPDGKWGKKTQSKIEELFPDYKNGITQEQIDTVCDTINKENSGVEVSPTQDITTQNNQTGKANTSAEPDYTVTFGESKIKKRKLKEQVQIVGQRSSMSDDEFFKFALKQNCLPEWLNEPNIGNVKDKNGTVKRAIYGEDKENLNIKYAFFRDFTALNMTNKTSSTWECKPLLDYLNRPTTTTCDTLTKFNVDCNLGGDDLIRTLNNVTQILQTYVTDYNAVSNEIMEWKNMLEKKYSSFPTIKKITLPQGKTDIYPPADVDVLNSQFQPALDVSRYKFQGVNIYIPQRTTKLATQGPISGEKKDFCLNRLKNYLGRAIYYAAGAETEKMDKIDDFRVSIVKCANQGAYTGEVFKPEEIVDTNSFTGVAPFDKWGKEFEWKDVVQFLKGEVDDKPYSGKRLKLPNPYAVTLKENNIREKIKSTLVEMIQRKQKSLIQENLIRNRVEMLFENTTFKSRKQRNDFVIDLLQEALILESQGINKKVLKEEFWGVVKGFFGNEKTDSLFMSFKTRMAKWLISHLSPKKVDGWIANCIKKTIKEIEIRDVDKITDCDFLTKQISRSILKKLDEKMSDEKLKDEGIYDIVRGGMSDNVKSARFTEHVESKVKNMICPILKDMSNRFDSTFDEMKRRAVGL